MVKRFSPFTAMSFYPPGVISRTYHHVQRYREVIAVFLRYGFDEFLQLVHANRYLNSAFRISRRKKRKKVAVERSRPVRLRLALQDLGPTFVKMGQILSTRADLLPDEYIQELRKLEDDVPSVAYPEIKEKIETELHAEMDTLFSDFDKEPLAAASIAQIHRARLATGEQVVVKVQRPGLRQRIDTDLEIMYTLASLMEKHVDGWSIHQPSKIIRQMSHMLRKELDFTIEASHIQRFSHQFQKERTLHVPRVYSDVSSEKVLTLEFLDGIKATNLDLLKDKGYDLKQIARQTAELMMKQIFVHGFFHADPHAGNLFVLEKQEISFIDFGMMGTMNLRLRQHFADLLFHISRHDESAATDALLKLTTSQRTPERGALEADVAEFMTLHFYKPIRQMSFGRLLQELLNKTTRHGLRIPMEIFLLIKAVSTFESVVRQLDPDFDILKETAPYVRRVRMDRIHPSRLTRNLFESGLSALEFLKELPEDLRAFVRSIEEGRARVAFEHHGLGPLILGLERVSNRIAFAIVLAALVVGSSLMVHAGIPPTWNDIPVIGLIGFLLATVMGFGLLVSIIRHGKM